MPRGDRTAYHVWVPDEEAALRRWVAEGYGFKEIAEKLGRRHDSVKNKAQQLGLRQRDAAFARWQDAATLTRTVREDATVTITAPEETADESADAFLARVLHKTGRAVGIAKAERFVQLRIASAEPIALSISSDWHLSAEGATDVQGILDYADAVRETPRLYALGVGDLTDNPIKHKPTDIPSIKDEHRLLDLVLGRFGGKLLGTTSGNHDDWLRTMVGLDNLKTMAEKHRLHYAPDELIWVVEIVDPSDATDVTARWVVATRHQYRRHSNLNHTHACWRWLEENANNWPTDGKGSTLLPDVLAIGHNHVAAVEHRTYDRGVVIACRMGAWQITSPYTRAGGWTLMPPTAPTVILPNVRDPEHQPHAYDRWQDAVRHLAA